MAAPLNASTDRVSSEEVRQTLTRIIQSKYFAHAPKKQRFVQVICDYYLQGRAAELNEYLIGCEVFDKGAEYQPSVDPVVRVGAHDVRKKLESYYQHEGADDPVRLSIPVGTYVPLFVRQPIAINTEPLAAVITEPKTENARAGRIARQTWHPSTSLVTRLVPLSGALFFGAWERKLRRYVKQLFLLAMVVILLLLGVVVWLVRQNRNLAAQSIVVPAVATKLRTSTSGIWQPFLANKNPTLLILSNPVVYRLVNGADPEIITKQGIGLTPAQTNLIASLSNHRLPVRPEHSMQLIPALNMYTGIGEAIGVYRLSHWLQEAGEATLLKQSRSLGADDLKEQNVVMLGSVYSNQWAMPVAVKENFVYGSRTSIENLAPRPGEQTEYRSLFDQRTGALLEDYALITVMTGANGTNTLMALSGIYSEGTQAAAEFITDPDHLTDLEQRLRGNKAAASLPRYFQALLKVRVENS
ncbi:MAG: hypothetical protein U0Y68_22980, partial [Blastocatellia bacterium]